MAQNRVGAPQPLDDLSAKYAIEQLLNESKGSIIVSAERMVEEVGWQGETRMSNAQLNQLKSVAQQAQSVEQITEWVKYQASRLEAWEEAERTLLPYLQSDTSEASMRYKTADIVAEYPELQTHEDYIWLSLCRLFTGYLQRQFVIVRERGEQHARI